MAEINWDLPIQTRDGQEVQIIARDIDTLDSGRTVIGIREGVVQTWFSNGRVLPTVESSLDLVNAPVKYFVNLYRGNIRSGKLVYPSLEEARKAVVYSDYLATVEVATVEVSIVPK